MKLSELKSKLGLAANATEAQVNTALEAAVTLANEAVLANGGPGSGPRKKFETVPFTHLGQLASTYGHKAVAATDATEKAVSDNTKESHEAAANAHDEAAKEASTHFGGEGGKEIVDSHNKSSAWHRDQAANIKANEGTSEGAPATFLSMVNELVRSKCLSFNDAWANVKMEHPEQYQAMSRPAAVK